MSDRRTAILYISYDGMLEPLGQSQVLSYLERLSTQFDVHLLSFEKPGDLARADLLASVDARVAKAGIRWTRLRYHKAPSAPATAFDIAAGSLIASGIAVRRGIRIIHARSYVAGLMALAAKRASKARFLFDMRGLWADERVDGGLWPSGGRLFRAAKGAEARLLAGADHVVTLTDASVGEIGRLARVAGNDPAVSVIPTCTDLGRFRPPTASAEGNCPFTLGYVGSVGTWYLLDEMLRSFVATKTVRPNARLLVVNQSEQALIRERMAHLAIDPAEVELTGARHDEVPALIGRMDAGMAIIKPVYSKLASAPTKLGEYLACGVPCLGNVDVGDMESILEGRRVGVALREFSELALVEASGRLVALAQDPEARARCRSVAEDLFSLDRGVEAYAAIYRDLGQSPA